MDEQGGRRRARRGLRAALVRGVGVRLASLGVASLGVASLAPFAVAAADPPAKTHASPDVVVVAQRRQQPATTPPPLSLYAQSPRFEQIALSPSGDQVAFITDVDGVRLLIGYRFADKSRRLLKLGPGDITSIAWVDPDHVVLADERTALRGTCDARDETTIVNHFQAQVSGMQSVIDGLEGSANPADQQKASSLIQLLNTVHLHPCVYFGVRSQYALGVVNFAKNAGQSLGFRFGEVQNLPLDLPLSVEVGGKTRVIGPFLELRDAPSGDQPAERVYLWSADPDTGAGKLIDDGGGDVERETRYVDDWLLDPAGAPVARAVYDYDARGFSIEMKQKGAWKAILTRKIDTDTPSFAPALVGLGRDDGSIIIFDQVKSGTATAYHYQQLSADGALSAPLEPDDAAARPVFNPATRRFAGFIAHGDTDTQALTDPDLAAFYARAQSAAPDETVRVVSTAADPRRMVIRAQSRDDPGSYFFIDYAAGTSTPLGEDYADLPTEWIAGQSDFSYKAADGLDIHGQLTLPPKPKPQNLPLVVLPHDGPGDHDRAGFDWLAQALASRGYAVLQPNYRGSDGYGRAFRDAGDGEWGGKMQSDLSDGVQALVGQGVVDPVRVCILGFGYGGYAALEAATRSPAPYRCAAAINGVFDPQAYLSWRKSRVLSPIQARITDLAPDPQAPRTFQVDPNSPKVLAAQIGALGDDRTPVKQAASISIPILLIAEADDRTVPVGQSEAMASALSGHGKPATFLKLKGASHTLAAESDRLAALTAIIDFLAKNNPAP
jgi:dienelactone hydrolase